MESAGTWYIWPLLSTITRWLGSTRTTSPSASAFGGLSVFDGELPCSVRSGSIVVEHPATATTSITAAIAENERMVSPPAQPGTSKALANERLNGGARRTVRRTDRPWCPAYR